MRRWKNTLVALPLACAITLSILGCQPEKRGPTAKEMATREWNAARASVLGSLAADQYKDGNFEKSRQTIAQALKLTPANASLHLLSAKLAIEGGQLELAERELKLARDFAPVDGEALYLTGVVYQRWQKPELAFQFYQQAAGKMPAELAYVMAEGEMLVAMKRTPEALSLLQSKVAYFEHSGAIRDAVGQMLMQEGRFPEAAAALREASILSENDQGVRERLAMALYAAGDYRQSSDLLSKLVASEPTSHRADLFVLLGQCHLHLGDPRAARNAFDTATQLDFLSPAAWQGLGRAALECGDSRRAEAALTHSIALGASSSESHLLLGYVRLKNRKLNDALAAFHQANVLDPSDPVSVCMMGYVLREQGRAKEAIQYFRLAQQLKPDDEMARQLMASIVLHD